MHAEIDILKTPSVVIRITERTWPTISFYYTFLTYFIFIASWKSFVQINDFYFWPWLLFSWIKGKQTQTGGLIASGTEDAEGPEECYKRTATDQVISSLGELLPLCSKDLQLKIMNMYSEVLCDPIVNCEFY